MEDELYETTVFCDDLDWATEFATPASILIIGEQTDAVREFVKTIRVTAPFDRIVTDLDNLDRLCEQYALVRTDMNNSNRNVAFYFDCLPSSYVRNSGVYKDLLINGTAHGVSVIQRLHNPTEMNDYEQQWFDYIAFEDENCLNDSAALTNTNDDYNNAETDLAAEFVDLSQQSDYSDSDTQSEDITDQDAETEQTTHRQERTSHWLTSWFW